MKQSGHASSNEEVETGYRMKTMKWEKLLNNTRLAQEEKVKAHTSAGRTSFDADVDRVIFSGAFRRLSRKTQVHPLAANDHVHTRLTHSLEVARVGRTMARQVGAWLEAKKLLPKNRTQHDLGSIVEAACLAHDVGNPPFGHAGEEAMRHWFDLNGPSLFGRISKKYRHDLIGVEGNAQGFRTITQTENHLFDGGLRLTYATLASFLKYPWTSMRGGKKIGAYLAEEAILEKVCEGVGMIESSDGGWHRHPLAQIMEAADDLCYAVLDLEDAVELRILQFDEVSESLLRHLEPSVRKAVESSYALSTKPKTSPKYAVPFRVNLSRLRGPVFDHAMKGFNEAFQEKYEEIMTGKLNSGLLKALPADDSRRQLVESAKQLSADHVFPDAKKVELEVGAYATFDTLLSAFCRAAVDQAGHLTAHNDESDIGWKNTLVLRLLGDHAPSRENALQGKSWTPYHCLRRAIDFVSGMTDNYATYIARQLQGGGFSGGQRP